ncbi:chloride intracellular channel protein 2-like [Acropora muricata]|uniref:chloride intracellular channel protein 2-like n=1 Tax=Acropora muricata TaxID=159855 RepID=UPI0034E49D8C
MPLESISGFYLLVRAASDESSIAACPLTHQVRMICKLKGIEPTTTPFNIQKKSREFLEINSTGKVPVLVHQVNPDEAFVLDDPLLIAKYLEDLFPDPPLRSQSKDAIIAGSDIFQKFCALIKNKDPIKDPVLQTSLLKKIEELDLLLQSDHGIFLEGDTVRLSDCSLLSKLLVVRVAAKEFKGFEIPARMKRVWDYIHAGEKQSAFIETRPSDELIKEHWSRNFAVPLTERFIRK